MNRLTNILDKAYRSDSRPRATWILTCSAITKVRDWVQSKLLNAPELHLGAGSVIRGANYISFGRRIFVNRNLWLEALPSYSYQRFTPRIEIGDFVSISNNVHISCIDHIAIKSNTLIGSNVYISDHNHGVYRGTNQSQPNEPPNQRQLKGGPVFIGENVWIGDNVVIVGPVTIGNGAVIGANSVIKGDVLAETIVAGIPARTIRQFNRSSGCWEKI